MVVPNAGDHSARTVYRPGQTKTPSESPVTTDTAAVLRGLEINADLICKATRVDGVYDKDPLTNSDAIKFDQLSFAEVLQRQLKVMDAAAISLAMDNKKPILVFNMNRPGNMKDAICGKPTGTLIR